MREEERIFAGLLFKPGHPDLRAIKLRTHNLNTTTTPPTSMKRKNAPSCSNRWWAA